MTPIKKYFSFTLDLKRESKVQLKGIIDGDTGNVFKINITSDGEPLDPADVKLSRVIFTVQSNRGWASQDSSMDEGGITISNDGMITIDVFAGTYAEGGNYAALEIYTSQEGAEDDVLVTTQHFTFQAKHGSQSGVKSSEAYPALIKAINDVYKAIGDMRYIVDIRIDSESAHLLIEMDDGTIIDCGAVGSFYGNSSVSENLLPDAIPLTDSISDATSSVWTVEKSSAAVQMPTITPGRYINVKIPNSSGEHAVKLRRIERSGSVRIGHASFLSEINQGDSVCISFEVKMSEGCEICCCIKNGETEYKAWESYFSPRDVWYTAEYNFEIEAWDRNADSEMYIEISGEQTNDILIRLVKAEKSPIRTDWLPAPKDIKDLIYDIVRTSKHAFSFESTADGMSMTVEDEAGEHTVIIPGLDQIYPVGSIYMSVNSTSPATLFGGTWQQISDTFLLAAGSTYTAGSTGGEATHALTEGEIPSHTHVEQVVCTAGVRTWASAGSSSGSNKYFNLQENLTVSPNDNEEQVVKTLSTGGGTAHNNMPPYLAVYVWKRTA